jgi:paraquat-inducible protein B
MRGAAWRVGLFAAFGVALLVLAVVLVGGRWFAASEDALMRFRTSVYGLQVGAPVVFRGVRVGTVTRIGLVPPAGGAIWIPVTAQLDRALLRGLLGANTEAGAAAAVPALVGRGLVARLAQQSLLTGQLYVDMDLEPARAGAAAAAPQAAAAGTLPEIPTTPTPTGPLQDLQGQIALLDLGRIGRDISAAAQAIQKFFAGPELARAVQRAASAAAALERLAQRAEREVGPLSQSAQALSNAGQRTLADARTALAQLGSSAREVASAASAAQQQLGEGVRSVGGAAVPALASVQRAAEELARAAQGVRAVVGEDSTLRGEAERAMHDVSRAARAVRDLAEALDRQPDALIRGRAAPAGAP